MANPLTKQVFEFINKLKMNNDRDWFNTHKDEYTQAHEQVIAFADELLMLMNSHDDIETPTGKKALFRIYRDVRFSKNKDPYKTHLSGRLARAGKELRGGYYFHIEPGNTLIATGFFSPEKDDLQRIREEIDVDAGSLRKIINEQSFIETFDQLEGEELKSAPRGFDKNHSDIDLLRKKQFYMVRKFNDQEVLADDFVKKVSDSYRAARPFLDYMSMVLTTDANGLPIE